MTMPGMTREAVGVFDNLESLNAAVTELENTAFPRQDISVLGSTGEMKKEFHQAFVPPQRLEDNPVAPRTVLIRPEEWTIGTSAFIGCAVYIGAVGSALLTGNAPMLVYLVSTAAGGAVCGTLAAVVVRAMSRRFLRNRERQVQAGGLVLWVRTPDADKENTARAILSKNGGRDVHIHEIH